MQGRIRRGCLNEEAMACVILTDIDLYTPLHYASYGSKRLPYPKGSEGIIAQIQLFLKYIAAALMDRLRDTICTVGKMGASYKWACSHELLRHSLA